MRVDFSKQRGTMKLRHRARFERVLQCAPAIVGLDWKGSLNVVMTNSRTMAEINEQYVGHQGTTDVITFDLRVDALGVEDECLGEIYICPDVALEYARKHHVDASRELVLYAVHGMLHLHGEDDLDEMSRAEMRRGEARVMAELERLFDLSDFIGDEDE